MNKIECDILVALYRGGFANQRELAEAAGCSLGSANKALKTLEAEQMIDSKFEITSKAKRLLCQNKPQRAVILAAGYGMRMAPINTDTPKGLLEAHGEKLIERTLKQLHFAGINEIYIVVGYMKEKFEYLIDKYNVKLIYNKDYAEKNNLYSLKCAADYLENAYIIPCDIRCEKNPYSEHELYSWYMLSDERDGKYGVEIGRNGEIVLDNNGKKQYKMIGICYLNSEKSKSVRQKADTLCLDNSNNDLFWEETLTNKNKMNIYAKVMSRFDIAEINTYEQLRDLDEDSAHLKTKAIELICRVFDAASKDITNIAVQKKGMTNRSFTFVCKGKKYIMRVPGEGTEFLINRENEAAVYSVINKTGICDNVIYIDPKTGYKITEFIDNTSVCNPFDENDVKEAMMFLKQFHSKKLKVSHTFDIFGQIEFYESLWQGKDSVFIDYKTTKNNVLSLKEYIDSHANEKVLTHIDAVPDNFLIYKDGDKKFVKLIDWEYAGMQDPHVDIAMFAIYTGYNKEQLDKLIDIYFEGACSEENRIKIYCYVACCGLLWSNWCEYKRNLGVEFGEYSLLQYRYAKEYYKKAKKRMEKLKGNENE